MMCGWLSCWNHYICYMKTITLVVSDPTAEKLERMSDSEKKSIAESLDILVGRKRSMEEIMKDASEQARKNGLTPELLEQLINQK